MVLVVVVCVVAGLSLKQVVERFRTIYRELGSWQWGVGAGCRLWRLPPSRFLNDWRGVAAEVVVMWRWFQSVMVHEKKELNRAVLGQ